MTERLNLNFEALRVLGSLMEKEMTTPDAYPLSLNALLAAANQRSSRDPVTDLTEDEVRSALDTLEAHELVAPTRGSRVPRYEHRIRTVVALRRDETAVLCLLLLRGPQTVGELRGRSDRMFAFDDLAAVQATLERMAAREVPLAASMARVPGSRETRWQHLLGDPATEAVAAPPASAAVSPASAAVGEISVLREAVESLTLRVARLEARLRAVGLSDEADA